MVSNTNKFRTGKSNPKERCRGENRAPLFRHMRFLEGSERQSPR